MFRVIDSVQYVPLENHVSFFQHGRIIFLIPYQIIVLIFVWETMN